MWLKCFALLALALTAAWPATGRAGPDRPAAEGSGLADGVFPRRLIHPFGETTVETAPKRIVVLATGQLDALLTLDVVPVGASRVDGRALYGDYLAKTFPDLGPRMATIADLGTRASPDIEAIAGLHPDLILMNAALGRRDLYDRLSRIAPTMVTHGTGVNWRTDFLLVADALGRRGAAESYLAGMADRARTVKAGWAGHAPSVSFVMSLAGRTRVFGAASFAGGIAEDLGLARPPDQRFSGTSQDVSEELLDRLDADWIFFATRNGAREGAAASPLWPTLKAVGAGHAIAVDIDAFYLNAGPTAARLVQDALVRTLVR